jgi:hypothetical protein
MWKRNCQGKWHKRQEEEEFEATAWPDLFKEDGSRRYARKYGLRCK